MSEQLPSSGGSPSASVPYQSLPMSALQAMYFAVTGKTESISKNFTRNVRITLEDVRVLHAKILQKLEHFVTPVPPTVTILAKMHNKQSLRYSSWERFQMFEVASNDVTSELNIKYEFLIQLPNIENPQRCVISITIDSKMPVLKDELDHSFDDDFFMIIGLDRFPTVKLTVEFVDFLVGKEYQQIVEEWFEHLPEVSSPSWAVKVSRWGFRKIEILSDMNLIGVAAFIFIVPRAFPDALSSMNDLAIFAAVVFIVYIVTKMVTRQLVGAVERHVQRVIVPSLVIFTRGDEISAQKILNQQKISSGKVFRSLGFMASNVILNIIASIIYGKYMG